MTILRRDLLKNALALSAASILPNSSRALDLGPIISGMLPTAWSNDMPPLYVTAYIDPTIQSQKGQEGLVAKFPLALVPQESSFAFRQWRDKVKNLNPAIKLLAYQNVNGENIIPGPGHDILRKVNKQDVWVSYGGVSPTAFSGRRLYDPRKEVWENAFLDACEATYHSYPYSGLFLDNCTVFNIAAPLPSTRIAMVDSLRKVLVKLRQRLPDAIIIGNGIDHFPALNGAMNEGRPRDLPSEAAIRDYQPPIVNLFQCIMDMRNPNEGAIKAGLEIAIRNKSFFGLAHIDDYQHIYWSALFDDVIAAYGDNPPQQMKAPFVN